MVTRLEVIGAVKLLVEKNPRNAEQAIAILRGDPAGGAVLDATLAEVMSVVTFVDCLVLLAEVERGQ